MICFRDRAFCSARCDTTWCDRNFTPEQEARSIKWWDGWSLPGPPRVQFKPLHKTCVEYRPPQGERQPEGVDTRSEHGKVRHTIFADADPKISGEQKTGNGA